MVSSWSKPAQNKLWIVSIESFVLIAADWFGDVVFPLRRPFIGSKTCPFLIPATWIFGVAFLCPYLSAFQLFKHEEKSACVIRFKETFLGAFSLILFGLSFALMTILYSVILFKLKLEKIPGEQSAIAKQQRLTGEKTQQCSNWDGYSYCDRIPVLLGSCDCFNFSDGLFMGQHR